MTSALVEKLTDVRDFKKILETTVKEIGEKYTADVSQIVLSNPLDSNQTSICEYVANPEETPETLDSTTFPLHLEGGGLGLVSISRQTQLKESEINEIRITLAEIANILRYAQINDIVQRETFRNAFMSEITNLMNYSMGLGDALFMVVNILGKAINCSRCLFICMDESQAGWKCFEYWQRERIESSQDYGWPTKDSAIVSQSLLSFSPVTSFEGQPNSYMTPLQEEMQFIGVRSMLAVPIRSQQSVHGCIILQQCESRHAWTHDEIDMVQNVADTVAEALLRLPEEKRIQEPIMRLHQRDVADSTDPAKQNIQDVRKALKGALGKTAIPNARKASPAKEKATAAPKIISPPAAKPVGQEPPTPAPATTALEGLADMLATQANTSTASEPAPSQSSLQGLLGNILSKPGETSTSAVEFEAVQPPATPVDEKLGTGTVSDLPDSAENWNLDAIPTPKPSAERKFGDLDSIPTPTSGSQTRTGLGAVMMGKAKASSLAPQSSGLGSAFHKDKVKPPPTQFVEGPPIQINEAEAEAKLKQLLSTSNPTSDYIFSIPNIDPRLLGRIDGWISEVEQKDKYVNGHARAVAEYSVAVARLLGMTESEVNQIRLAAIVHDVGKLGLPIHVLQKPDEELTDAELVMTMNHPIDGAKLVEAFPELADIVPLVLAHHEEYDGNGYPEGLSGEAIPLGARIIHVANSYHTMVSDLVYRAGLPPERAQNALMTGAGATYDPDIVQALLACISQGLVPAKIT